MYGSQQTYYFCTVYRPPNSNVSYLTDVEDSIALAVDTGISEMTITGDLDLNTLSSPTRQKLEALCTQFMPFQSLTQPIHYLYHIFCEALDSGKEVGAVICIIS